MIYVLGAVLVLSLVFNYFSMKLIGEQSIKLNRQDFELFSIKMQLELERAKQSQGEEGSSSFERTVQ